MAYLDITLLIGLIIKIYALLTPSAVLSAFISCYHEVSPRQRLIIAIKCSSAIFIIGELLYLFGSSIFDFFGFSLDAFRIGAGLLLFLNAIHLMRGDLDHPKPACDLDMSIVPLAIPLGMGPATIGMLVVMGASATSLQEMLACTLALFIASLGIAGLLCLAGPLEKALGQTGIAVMAKLTALLLSAVAAQAIFSGIKGFIHH